MTNSQKRKIQYIKSKLQQEIAEKNQKFNSNSIVLFEEIEKEHFVILKVKYQYDAKKSNVFNDESMQLFIFKKGRIEGEKRYFGNTTEIKNIWQVYF